MQHIGSTSDPDQGLGLNPPWFHLGSDPFALLVTSHSDTASVLMISITNTTPTKKRRRCILSDRYSLSACRVAYSYQTNKSISIHWLTFEEYLYVLNLAICYITLKLICKENSWAGVDSYTCLLSKMSSLRDKTLMACSKTEVTFSPICIAWTEKLQHKIFSIKRNCN